MPEQDPTPRTQPIIEGLEISARMHRVVDGVVELFDVMISQVRKNPEGQGHIGKVDVVDEFGMTYDEETVPLPDAIDLTEGKLLVYAEDTDENEESGNKRIVSRKVAAIIGGATLVGAAATVYWRIKD